MTYFTKKVLKYIKKGFKNIKLLKILKVNTQALLTDLSQSSCCAKNFIKIVNEYLLMMTG